MAQPSDPNLLLQRALSLHQSGKLDKAIALYRQLAARFPGNARVPFLLGSAESQNGNGGEAVRLLEQCLVLDPLNADAYNNLGLALEARERHDEALQSYDRAIALRPGSPEAYINKGLALRRGGHLQPALECFERALDLLPDNAEQHNSRGNVLLDLRRTEEALASSTGRSRSRRATRKRSPIAAARCSRWGGSRRRSPASIGRSPSDLISSNR